MLFANRLKGGITQGLIKALLEEAGYRVVPLGVEEVIREVSVLPIVQYMSLGLPTPLRSLPDFFISDAAMERHWLLEVKFRREWNQASRQALHDLLKPQVQVWRPLVVLVFLGVPAQNVPAGQEALPSYHMRAAKLDIGNDGELWLMNGLNEQMVRWLEATWTHMDRIQDVFTTVVAGYEELTLCQVRSLLPKLMELDTFAN